MHSFFSVGFGGNARRTAAQEGTTKSSGSKRQSPDEEGGGTMPTSDGVEEEKPEVDDSWVIRQDSGGRPFWWHARTGGWAYLPHYVYGSASPNPTGYNYLAHYQHHQYQPLPLLMFPQHAVGYPTPASVVGSGFGAANTAAPPSVWVVTPPTSPVVVPVVPVEKTLQVQRPKMAEGGAVGSEEGKSKSAQEQQKPGGKQGGHTDGSSKGSEPRDLEWEKFYAEDGRAVWIHSDSGKLRKTDPYM